MWAVWLVLYGVLLIFVSGMLFVVVNVLRGNLRAMRLLASLGVCVFSGNVNKDFELLKHINKDALGWLSIPNICYSPVMGYTGGKYETVSFLNKPSKSGEIYVSHNDNTLKLSSVAKKSTNTFQDLCVLSGSSKGGHEHMRASNFSHLQMFAKRRRCDGDEVILLDSGVRRRFRIFCSIAANLGDDSLGGIPYSDRGRFVSEVQKLSGYTLREVPNDIIILRCCTDIGSLLVFLVEIDYVTDLV